jgi:hypothetical protein
MEDRHSMYAERPEDRSGQKTVMNTSREAVLEDLLQRLRRLSGGWEDAGAISEETYLLGNMNWQSINLVVLANEMQEYYARVFPFSEFFAEVSQKDEKDVSVREWVDFVYGNLQRPGHP